MDKLRLLFSFYKSMFVANTAVTTGIMAIVFSYGSSPFFFLFWFKAIVLASILYANSQYKSKEFFYYFNLGISKKQLWTFTVIADFILFFALFFLTLKIRQ